MTFHINPVTGNPGECSAKPGNCPYASESEHYGSKDEARFAYEKKMEKLNFTRPGNPTLDELVSSKNFAKAIADGLISERAHPDDPDLRIYSYTKTVQFSGMWTPETLLARGLILRVPDDDLGKAEVVGRGLRKFFTVEQMDSDWSKVKLVDDDEEVTITETPDISWDAPAVVAEKMNGALGLAYVAPDGGISIATKGSFGSLEAEEGSRLARSLTPEQQVVFAEIVKRGETPLFEIITPKRPHPVSYGDKEALIFLGSVNNRSGKWTPTTEDSSFVQKFGFESAPRLPYKSLAEAVRAPYRLNTEGFVVTVAGKHGQELYKVKPAEYHALRRFFYASTPRELTTGFAKLKAEEIIAIKGVDDIKFPEELVSAIDPKSPLLRERGELAYNELIAPVQKRAKAAEDRIRELVKDLGSDPDKKAVAMRVKQEPSADQALLFRAFSDLQNGTRSVYEAARDAHFKSL